MDRKGTQPYIYMHPFSPSTPPPYSGWHMTLMSRSLLVIHFKWSSMKHWFDLLFLKDCLGFRHKQGEALGRYFPKVLGVFSNLNHRSKNVK